MRSWTRQTGVCRCGKPAVTKGMCRPCYAKQWHAAHPEQKTQTISKPDPLIRWPIEHKVRNCLKCGELFQSQSRFNKCCDLCNVQNERIGDRYDIHIRGRVRTRD